MRSERTRGLHSESRRNTGNENSLALKIYFRQNLICRRSFSKHFCHRVSPYYFRFSVLGIVRRAFAEMPASLLFCLPFRRRVRRAKLRARDLRSDLSASLCVLLPVSTSLQAARWRKSVLRLLPRA